MSTIQGQKMNRMENMTSRERVRTALDLKTPDRVPLDIGGTTATSIDVVVYEKLKRLWDIESETVYMSKRANLVLPCEEVLQRLHVDTRGLILGTPDGRPDRVKDDGTIVDEWGVIWQCAQDGHHYNPVGAPLMEAGRGDLTKFDWPDPADPGRTRGLAERARYLHEETDYAVTLSCPVGIGHLYQYLRGYEQFLIDIMVDEVFAEDLLDRILEVWLGITGHALDTTGPYLDVVMFPDDLAFQDRPIMRPEIYRRLIKPRHEQMVDLIYEKCDAAVLFHSCGAIFDLIPDLIQIGIDALNPVQVSAKDMDTAQLKLSYGDAICFWGAIDTHHVLPHGTPDEVREEVRHRIQDLAAYGGYVAAAVHDIQSDVSPENVIAMAEEVHNFGKQVASLQYPYSAPVEKLLKLGDVYGQRKWRNYIDEFGFDSTHISSLIHMVMNPRLHWADSKNDEVWGPLHAWRALGQLGAEKAIKPLINLFNELEDDDWMNEELPVVLGMIGPAAIEPLQNFLTDKQNNLFPRINAAESLREIGERHPEARDECIKLLTNQLRQYNENHPTLNGFIIYNLTQLGAVESARLMKRAFRTGAVDEFVMGDWPAVQVELGLKKPEGVKSRFLKTPEEIEQEIQRIKPPSSRAERKARKEKSRRKREQEKK